MDPTLGQIELFPYDFVPQGWAPCNGALLPIAQYTGLFSLIRTRFGGDGTTTFALPAMQGKEPVPNTTYCIALVGVLPSRP